jgi:hypothetical protein
VDALDELVERMNLCWIVDDDGTPHEWPGEPVRWSRWMWEQKRPGGLCVVGRAEWPDGTRVSTMFLGIDMSFGMGPGLFWETMVFGPAYDHDRPQRRYTTQRHALIGHREMVLVVEHAMTTPAHYREEWIPPEARLTAGTSRITMQGPGTVGAQAVAGEESSLGTDDGPSGTELQPA